MSKKSSLRAKLEQLARHQDENQDRSTIDEEPANYVLRPIGQELPDSVMIARRLIETGVRPRVAHRALTKIAKMLAVPTEQRDGLAIHLPDVPNPMALEADLRRLGVMAERRSVPDSIDVAAIRGKLGLSQEEFALRFGLDVSTVRNWEQGRYHPDVAARVLLRVIERHPAVVEGALVDA